MSIHVKVFIALLVAGTVAILGYRFALPHLQDAWQRQTSDAAATRGRIVVGVDSWVGYFPLCSPELARRMRAEGYLLRCEDDGADYPRRMQGLASGALDYAVATADSYLLNGAAVEYPAAIVAVIDESKGGDAIIARRDRIPDLDALKTRKDARIAFTPASPSEFLLKSVGVHFDLPQWQQPKGPWRVETQGSAAAAEALSRGDVDVAVLWEPDVSRALRDPALVKLIGSEDLEGLIVDVLLASRRAVQNPEPLRVLLAQYFETLRYYGERPEELRREVAQYAQVPADQVESLLRGVAWATLPDNAALWFGVDAQGGAVSRDALSGTLRSDLEILMRIGDFQKNPLPDQDPYRITNRQFVGALYLPAAQDPVSSPDPLRRPFAALDEAGWARLKPVGTLRIDPVNFARGTATLDDEGRRSLDSIAETLRHYPNYRLLIKGHTATGGDPQANLDLSAQRARAAAEYLEQARELDPNRLRALGYGGMQPLPRQADESDRAYAYRLPRVEFALLAEPY
jgi:outer membrane protein OmpA-like peptidoglycan-associated protein/ABC-type nitrate/sulfonate/bicarbonate transport system substrate-binding protein